MTPDEQTRLEAQLVKHEGLRLVPYTDTVGKLTIGVGHNLDDKGLSPEAIAFILEKDIDDAEYDARSLFPNFDDLSDARKAVLIQMAFNLGSASALGVIILVILLAITIVMFRVRAKEETGL